MEYVPSGVPSTSFFLTVGRRELLYGSNDIERVRGGNGMKVYALTDLGKKVVRSASASAEDLRILEYIWNNKTATDDQLDVVGERWRVRRMIPKFVKEL